MTQPASSHAGHVPTEEQCAHVRELVARVGLAAAARELGMGREAVTKIAAGYPVKPGTLALVEQSLARSAGGDPRQVPMFTPAAKR